MVEATLKVGWITNKFRCERGHKGTMKSFDCAFSYAMSGFFDHIGQTTTLVSDDQFSKVLSHPFTRRNAQIGTEDEG